MSKLRDLTRDLGRRRAAAFGFAAMRVPAAERPRQLLVIAEVTDPAAAADATGAGADALLYTGALTSLVAAVAAAGKAPVGIRIDAATGADAAAAAEAGADFLAFDDANTDAAAVAEPRLGYLAMVRPDADDASVRLLRFLELDGIVVRAPGERMTVRQQLQTRRISELARKPLLIRVDTAVLTSTLEGWRDAGIVAILTPASAVAALIAAATEVPPRREPKPAGRADAIVPAARASVEEEDDDE